MSSSFGGFGLIQEAIMNYVEIRPQYLGRNLQGFANRKW